MSIELNCGTTPEGLEIKTGLFSSDVCLGDYRISLQDFLVAAHYVLTNTNLQEGDPRLQFIQCVRSMEVVPGYVEIVKGKQLETTRLDTSEPPAVYKKD